MLNLDTRPNSKAAFELMNEVIEYNGWNMYRSEPFWNDTELDRNNFSNLFEMLERTGNLSFKNVLYFLCEENLRTNIQEVAALCKQAQEAYSLLFKSRMLTQELIKNLPGAAAKPYYELSQYFPNNSVYIAEMEYNNKTFYIWVYRYGPHWDEQDEFGNYQRRYCALKDYFYKLFLNNMDSIPTGYHIFCPYTSTATDNKHIVNDIILWNTFKELRTKRIVDLITNKLKYAKWDSTIRKMHPKQSELDMFLGETVSYMNKGLWNQYVDELKNLPDGFARKPLTEAEIKKTAHFAVQVSTSIDGSVRWYDETILRDGNIYSISGMVEFCTDNGQRISQEYSVKIKNDIIVYTKIGNDVFGVDN